MDSFDQPGSGHSQRFPPSNAQAEQALLGALLANNKAFERVSDFLAPEHFADPIHGRIFQAIARRCEQNMVADPITLRAELEHSGMLEEVGGTAYLAQLLSAMVGIINAGDYGRLIHDAWVRRQLIDIGEVMVNDAYASEAEVDGRAQIERSEQALFNLATKGGAEGKGISFHDALIQAIDMAEKAFRNQGSVSGLDTGLRDLNKRTGGLHKSDLV
ncbi:MAG: replicative DNA helicase, partial [Rhodospirillales bacterium]|nr:replicative DNA helicase [Rhodospirillales bacterium]